MAYKQLFFLGCFLLFGKNTILAQNGDSAVFAAVQVSPKYLSIVKKKASKLSTRIHQKTVHTLTKLARWENRLKSLLQKTNPAQAEQLFGQATISFEQVLKQYQAGTLQLNEKGTEYEAYQDELQTGFRYLSQDSALATGSKGLAITSTNERLEQLDAETQQQAAIQIFIRQRKKQLVDAAFKEMGNSKYVQKISKEAYYYTETIRNYKEIFKDKKKAEKAALDVLQKIPAFQKFIREHSLLARLFPTVDINTAAGQANMQGLQTRASVNALIQNVIAAGGPNTQQQITEHIQAGQNQLTALKNKVLQMGGSNSDADIPNFKPNTQKSKTFWQRLDIGANIQPIKGNNYFPSATDMAITLGYKFSDKATAGLGASYKLGLGSWQNISLSSQGIGLRSYAEWAIKQQFFITGGYEMNYNNSFKSIAVLQQYDAWQAAALIGISKKINIKTKLAKGTKLQLLYDALANRNVPNTQQWVFRVGYQF